jgi:hypothetical protein
MDRDKPCLVHSWKREKEKKKSQIPVATDIKHSYPPAIFKPGWQSGPIPFVSAGGSPNAAGSRPVVPFRDAWVQIGRAALDLP